MPLQVEDKDKTPQELLLLGNKTVTINDCEGHNVEVHGLTANDLIVKTLQGTDVPLVQFIQGYIGSDLTNATVTDSHGDTVTLRTVVDAVSTVQFQIADLIQKYENN